MKKIYNLRNAGILVMLLTLISCNYDDPVASFVTNYPTLTMNGDRITVITEGTPYTEAGVVAFEGETEIDVNIDGTVDTNTPGVYNIYYSAENSDGYPAEVRRIIIVLSAAPSAINLEGTFFRNGFANNVTRLSDRTYRCDNAGGLDDSDPDVKLNVMFYNIDDVRVYVPYQENVSVSGIDVESNIGTIVNENSFNWVLTASATYGTAVRNFTR